MAPSWSPALAAKKARRATGRRGEKSVSRPVPVLAKFWQKGAQVEQLPTMVGGSSLGAASPFRPVCQQTELTPLWVPSLPRFRTPARRWHFLIDRGHRPLLSPIGWWCALLPDECGLG